MQNRFIIIVPTREREDTLFYTLKTLINIKYDNYKILVCDNASKDDTADIVSNFRSDKLDYVRTPQRLSMSSNWEFALSKIKETECYVSFIGDDDAFLSYSLIEINHLINKHKVDAITWKKIEYCWPNHICSEYQNYLCIPFNNFYSLINSEQKRKEFLNFSSDFNTLPCLYNSFVNIKILEKVKKHGNKIFFNSISPDVYSGIALSYFVNEYIYCDRPFSINGASNHSNGTVSMHKPNSSLAIQFLNELDIKPDNRLVLGPSIILAIAIECYNVYKYLKFDDSNIEIDKIAKEVKQELQWYNGPRYEALIIAFKELIQKNNLSQYYLKDLPETKPDIEIKIKFGFDYGRQTLTINCKDINSKNVAEVANVIENFLPPFEELKYNYRTKSLIEKTHGKKKITELIKMSLKTIIVKPLSLLGYRINRIPSKNKITEEIKRQELEDWYMKDYELFIKLTDNDSSFLISPSFPCKDDKMKNSGVANGDYFHQDLFVAKQIFKRKPAKHVDVGSRVDGFVAHVATFREVEVFDIRNLESKIENIIFRQADLMEDDFLLNNYCDSISCLHVLEHFGLGRYGDKIDPQGHLKGFENITKMLKSNGIFYFSVPLGKQRIEFNAHRIFSLQYLIDWVMKDFIIISFSYIDDRGDFYENNEITNRMTVENCGCDHGCAIFVLQKKLINHD